MAQILFEAVVESARGGGRLGPGGFLGRSRQAGNRWRLHGRSSLGLADAADHGFIREQSVDERLLLTRCQGASALRHAAAPGASQAVIAGCWSSAVPMFRRRRSASSSRRSTIPFRLRSPAGRLTVVGATCGRAGARSRSPARRRAGRRAARGGAAPEPAPRTDSTSGTGIFLPRLAVRGMSSSRPLRRHRPRCRRPLWRCVSWVLTPHTPAHLPLLSKASRLPSELQSYVPA